MFIDRQADGRELLIDSEGVISLAQQSMLYSLFAEISTINSSLELAPPPQGHLMKFENLSKQRQTAK